MEDTTGEIMRIQNEIWMAKTPEERLKQSLKDNTAFYKMCDAAKEQLEQQYLDNKTNL
jgi:cell division protein FtsL